MEHAPKSAALAPLPQRTSGPRVKNARVRQPRERQSSRDLSTGGPTKDRQSSQNHQSSQQFTADPPVVVEPPMAQWPWQVELPEFPPPGLAAWWNCESNQPNQPNQRI